MRIVIRGPTGVALHSACPDHAPGPTGMAGVGGRAAGAGAGIRGAFLLLCTHAAILGRSAPVLGGSIASLIVNAPTHIGGAIRAHRHVPGLAAGVLRYLPLGVCAFVASLIARRATRRQALAAVPRVWPGLARLIRLRGAGADLLMLLPLLVAGACTSLPPGTTVPRVTTAILPTDAVAQEIAALRRLAAAGDEAALAAALERSLVAIPAGEFVMGSDTGRSDERPAHAVYLDAYELDRYEVTNAQYRRFLLATGGRPPRHWTGDAYPAGQADYPVVGVSWAAADAYCRWAGKRLPTEAEWEKACRGTDGRIYPWGNAWEPGRANVDAVGWDFGGAAHDPETPTVWDVAWMRLTLPPGSPGPTLQPVGAHVDGASPYGILDMVGNVSEWVADWYNWSDYTGLPSRNPVVTGPPWNHCLRGSAWADPAGTPAWTQALSRCAARNSSHADSEPRAGFRCARSVRSE